jgi:hypothetical protein
MRMRRLAGWFARVGAFTGGAVVAQWLLPRRDDVGSWVLDAARTEVDAIAMEVGRSNDTRLARLVLTALRCTIGFMPPGRPRIPLGAAAPASRSRRPGAAS